MATDAFTGTNGTGLPTYSANWAYVVGGTTDLQIQSNAVACNVGTDSCCRSGHQAYGNDHFAEGVLAGVASGIYRGVAVRCGAAASQQFYGFYASSDDSYLFSFDGGSWSQIGATGGGFVNGDVIRLEVEGNALRPRRNGSATGTPGNQTDSLFASGVPGIVGYGGSVTELIDTWEGNDLGAAPSILPVFRQITNLLLRQ